MTTTRTLAGVMRSKARPTCASGRAPGGGAPLRPGKMTSFGATSGSPAGTSDGATSALAKNARHFADRSPFQPVNMVCSAVRSSIAVGIGVTSIGGQREVIDDESRIHAVRRHQLDAVVDRAQGRG